MRVLLRMGADVDALDIDCMTPLMHAAGGGFSEVCKCLLEAGSVARREDTAGRHAVSIAIEV